MSRSEGIHEEAIDIDQAQAMVVIMAAWVNKPEIRKELDIAEEAAKNSIHALIATGILTGDFPNDPEIITRLRAKLLMAFDIGYYFSKTHKVVAP